MESNEVSVRELRNQVSEVLRRAESGDHLVVTVRGRPVAQLGPLPRRRATMGWTEFWSRVKEFQADESLGADLRLVLTGTTDDL